MTDAIYSILPLDCLHGHDKVNIALLSYTWILTLLYCIQRV